MAYEVPLGQITLVAASSLATKQYYFVKIDSNGQAALAGAGESAIGVLQNKPAANEAATVVPLGLTKVVAGGSLTAGNNVAADASGKAVAAAGSAAVLGVALDGASSGDVVTIALYPRVSSGSSHGNSVLSIPVKLATVANGDLVTTYVPGFAGKIKKLSAVVTAAVTTAAKGATLNLEIGTTNLTGGVLTLTSANCTPLGAVIDATAITAANSFGASDSISVEAASVTTFVEGEILLLIVLGD